MINNLKVISIIMHNDLDGFLEVCCENWNGKIFKMSRSIIKNYNKDDLNCLGAYFLVCEGNENNSNAIYIRETKNIINRLRQHIQNYQKDKKLLLTLWFYFNWIWFR